jgi:hypothetical protein
MFTALHADIPKFSSLEQFPSQFNSPVGTQTLLRTLLPTKSEDIRIPNDFSTEPALRHRPSVGICHVEKASTPRSPPQIGAPSLESEELGNQLGHPSAESL